MQVIRNISHKTYPNRYGTKAFLNWSIFCSRIRIRIRILDTDPDPRDPNQSGSGFTNLPTGLADEKE